MKLCQLVAVAEKNQMIYELQILFREQDICLIVHQRCSVMNVNMNGIKNITHGKRETQNLIEKMMITNIMKIGIKFLTRGSEKEDHSFFVKNGYENMKFRAVFDKYDNWILRARLNRNRKKLTTGKEVSPCF